MSSNAKDKANSRRRIAIENVEFLKQEDSRKSGGSKGSSHRRHKTPPGESQRLAPFSDHSLRTDEAMTGTPAPWYGYGWYGAVPPNQPPYAGGQPPMSTPPAQRSVYTVPPHVTPQGYYASVPSYPGYASQPGYVPWPAGVQPHLQQQPPPPPYYSSSYSSSQVNQPPYPPTMTQPRSGMSGSAGRPVSPLQAQQPQPFVHPLKRAEIQPNTSFPEDEKSSKILWSDQGDEERTALIQRTAVTGYGSTSAGLTMTRPPARGKHHRTSKSATEVPTLPTLDSTEPQQSIRPTLNRPPAIRRSSSSGNFPASAMAAPPPPPKPRTSTKNHRRSHSDTPLQQHQSQHQRRKSYHPPTDPVRTRKRFPSSDMDSRVRSHSASAAHELGLSTPRPRSGSHHRRASSMSGAVSLLSDAPSLTSVVTDIRKSTFFGGYNEAGFAQMNFPIAHVHLTMDKHLPEGDLFQVPVSDRVYEEYVGATDDMEMGIYHDFDHPCNCSCHNGLDCTGKKDLLPPNYYVMSVSDDLYCNVVDEICASKEMPCGLFFCGHHEDVSRPSITIAVCILMALFAAMASIAYFTRV